MLLWLLLFAIKKVAFICLYSLLLFFFFISSFSPLSHLLSRLAILSYNEYITHRQSSRVRAYIRNERVRAHLTEYTLYTTELEERRLKTHRRIAQLIAAKYKTLLSVIQHQNDTQQMKCVVWPWKQHEIKKKYSHLKRNLRIKTSFFSLQFLPSQLARVWNEFQFFVSIFSALVAFLELIVSQMRSIAITTTTTTTKSASCIFWNGNITESIHFGLMMMAAAAAVVVVVVVVMVVAFREHRWKLK